MSAGRLRGRVTFEQEVKSPDGGGGASIEWGNGFSVWGGFKPERGQERMEAGRLQASLAGVLTVRGSSKVDRVTEDWSVLISVRGIESRYQIRSISNPDERGKYIEMSVEKGKAN